jgi:hypothetical protein
MNVVLEIEGRDALPVWVLPYISGWDTFSPDMLLDRFVNPHHDLLATFPTTFNLDTNNIPSPLPVAQWYEINNLMIQLKEELRVKELPKSEWRKRSIEIIKPLEAYIWLEEFVRWFDRSPYICNRHSIDEIDQMLKKQPVELCFNPLIPTEHARYFEDTELRKQKTKTPLYNLDKKIQDARITTIAPISLPLGHVISYLLVEATGDETPLHTFYRLIEKDGLVMANKNIEGEIVSSNELLRALQQREQEQPYDLMSIDDKGRNIKFWETLKTECLYSIFRDDFAQAYDNAGELQFPWLNYNNALIWLNVEDHIKANALHNDAEKQAVPLSVGGNNNDGALVPIVEKFDSDEELTALFDSVSKEVLEKMFPAKGKWKNWAERASRNGLINARIERAKFNPYKAAMWLLHKGESGYDLAHCNRILARNLPVRSRDEAHMITGELD